MKKIALLSLLFLFNITVIFAQWEDDVRLTNDDSISALAASRSKCIAANGDKVHIVWTDNRDGNFEIYYRRSIDAGKTWETEQRLTNSADSSRSPVIELAGDTLYVFWNDKRQGNYDIFLKTSSDAGLSWSEDKQITNTPGPTALFCVQVLGSEIFMTYRDESNTPGKYDIIYKYSIDAGETWSNEAKKNLIPDEWASSSALRAYGSKVFHAWLIYENDNFILYTNHSSDKGFSWSAPRIIGRSDNHNSAPQLHNSNENLILIWSFYIQPQYELFYNLSSDFGLSWSEDIRLTNSIGYSIWPSVITSDKNICVAWQDSRNSNNEIFYKYSNDFGGTWSKDTLLVDNNGTNSERPNIAHSGNCLHLIWQDMRNGPNGEIYYKRNPTGAPTLINETRQMEESIVYPVPADDFIQITNCEEAMEYEIMNILGVRIQSGKLLNNKIDVSKLSSGTYFIILKKQERISTRYFIIK